VLDMSSDALTITRVPDAIYEAMRESILTGYYEPGTPVTEQSIADRFQVARPTAKVALERLVSDGLLRRNAHKSARVPELTRSDIVDLYANRTILEEAALAALVSDRVVPVAAISAQRTLEQAARDNNTGPLARADIAFHRALVEAQHSPRLAKLHALLMGEIELCTGQVQSHRLVAIDDVISQHRGILDAVAAHDAPLATALTRAHIAGARDKLLARYDYVHPN
jgi:DNA-binding GntR family transcriptional regulator